ncbi:hypothetical protein A3842_20420 [Paenibacillus sp. P3E]|uniref:HupE/UreJ family protein n=1 Tax=Paenibacillus sp. P3E TaxID=1349435 RepID=UPI00093E9960|nr:HupE/UreJ family protein [Paenibacillus sp. P3E]OKP74621.1 hypothetical protein A3842_20420 [Paenibacillus sp. P3E]
MAKWVRLLALLFLLFGYLLDPGAPVSLAHGNVSVAYSELSLADGSIKFVLQLDMYDMIAEVNPDDPDLALTTPEALNRFFSKYPAEVDELLLTKIRLYADNLPLAGKVTQLRYTEKEGEVQPFAEAVIEYPIKNAPRQFTMDYNLVFDRDQWHVNYVNLSLGGLKKEAVLIAQITELQVGQMDPAYALKHFFQLGLDQSLRAYESILAVIVLLTGCLTTRQALRSAAVFAATQTLTLILGGLHVITLPERLLTALIPLSIVFLALTVLYNRNMKQLLWIAGALGLIHGFGYAAGLGGMRADGGSWNLVWPVTGFYGGVETVLLLLIVILVPATVYLRRLKYSLPVISATAAFTGLATFIVKALY